MQRNAGDKSLGYSISTGAEQDYPPKLFREAGSRLAVRCPGLAINAGAYKKEAAKFAKKFQNSKYQTEEK